MTGKVGGLGLLALTIFIAISFVLQLTSTPPRVQAARIDPFGDVKVHLETQPDPPKTGGIPLTIHITDASGKSVAVERAQFEYWAENNPMQTRAGDSLGNGEFKTVAALSSVGEWQIRVTLFKGAQQTQVTFTIRVMPNI